MLIKLLFVFIICNSIEVIIGKEVEVKPNVSHKSNHNSNHRSVSIGLSTNWWETPLYLEFAEFLSQENNELIWHYIQSIDQTLGTDSIESLSDKRQYELIMQLSDQLLGSQSMSSLVKYCLSIRYHSPTVVMFNQMANELLSQQNSLKSCQSFVELSHPLDTNTATDGYSRLNCKLTDTKTSYEWLTNALKEDIVLIHPNVHKSDHIFPNKGSIEPKITAVLYGQIGTKAFQEQHNYLKGLAEKGFIKYLFRHYIQTKMSRKVSLSGYGVELAIKSTEYKAQDDTRVKGEVTSNASLVEEDQTSKPDELEGFVFSKLKDKFPEKSAKLDEFQSHLMDKTKDIVTLKVWELQEISLQATKRVMNSDKRKALFVLQEIAQNFPTEARNVIKTKVDSDLKKEIEKNQQMFAQNLNLGTSDGALFVNGLYYDVDTIDVFTLLDVIKKELKLIEGLHRLVAGSDDKLKKLIKLDVSNDKQDFQIDIRDGAVVYVNDIETDKTYRNWPSSLQDMLRPTYPGMLRNVRKNIYHLVVVLDPSKRESHDILKLIESFYVHKAPVRLGIVFAVSPQDSVTGRQDAGVACLEAFNFISQDKTPYEGLSFLTDVIATVSADKEVQRDITSEDIINQFKTKYKTEDLEMIFGSDSDYDAGRKLANDFIVKTGIGKPIKALLNGVVLKETHLNAEMFEEVVLTEIMKQTSAVQRAIYKGELTDSDDVLTWLMSQKSVMPRLNRQVLNMDENSDVVQQYLDFNGNAFNLNEVVDSYNTMSLNDFHNSFATSLKYLSAKSDECSSVTVWFAADYETKQGREQLLAAVSHLRSNSLSMRLGVIHCSFGTISRVIESSILSISSKSNHLLSFLYKYLISYETLSNESNGYEIAVQLIAEEYKEVFQQNYNHLSEMSPTFKAHKTLCKRSLGLGGNDASVVINGRVIKISENEVFIEDDFSLIEKYVTNSFADKIVSELSPEERENPKLCSDLVLKISSVLLNKPQSKARHDIKYSSDKHSVLNLDPERPDDPSLELTAIFDPLTRGAQKLVPILITLYKVFNSRIKIYFNCVDRHSEMPLKSFYRFVIESEPKFGENEELLRNKAYFSSVPTSPLLTLGMAVPDNWLVESTQSLYDLDNIHLDQIDGTGITAEFELEHLLLEGHCFEQSSGNPPRGLQFTLGTNSTPVVVDTIVMANLGYFQLKANPGLWNLNLRQGRSADIYNIVSHEGTDSSPASSQVVALISSFKSHVIKIKVNKKVGKQNEELLYDSDDEDFDDVNSIWNSFSWSATPSKPKVKDNATEDGESDRINVFSLATGHLYERLLRIMIVSVLKNTKTPVKFWFLKNYLSPTFKYFLPFMAKHYGFEYELVQYKWPRWLHQQTDKQRIIWGYKILFLDVLFPLDVKKIIFVDADQVVRADLKELRDLDLEGAPYGYTPFCDSRKEMDGFRFWRTGYWATHLHGRKYHISALYVVDLQKFRRIAAGDRLRGQYQGLSQDPNSLSNLDQDLPNNMIHQVSIKSLPQEWLWCETWCDDDSKKTAKTIDLCNNPKTKEPKLTAARRIVTEWQDYDNEIKSLLKQFQDMSTNGTIDQFFDKTHVSEEEDSTTAGQHSTHIEL